MVAAKAGVGDMVGNVKEVGSRKQWGMRMCHKGGSVSVDEGLFWLYMYLVLIEM